MTTYKELTGVLIKRQTTNPGDPGAGQVWYNDTTGNLNGLANLEAFTSSADMSTGRQSGSGAGTQTAALYNGGYNNNTVCENYNGTGWSSIAALNTARQYAGGCGTETSALVYGNYPTANTTEEFNGSAWSAQEGFSTARRSGASFGLETAAVLAGGTTGPAVSTATEEYNGESWTGTGALSQARQYFAGAGIESAGLVFGGSNNPNTTIYTNTEEYDGSTWSNGGAMPAGRSMMFSWGTQSAAALSGGALPSTTATCLKYDGSTWSTSPATMGTATKQGYTSGTGTTQSAGLCAGGDPTVTRTEEFTASFNVITAAAWSSGGNLPTPNGTTTGGGPQTAAVQASGADDTNAAAEYNGSSWTAITDMSTGRYGCGSSSRGSQSGMLIFSGSPGSPGSTNVTNTELWNGSSWAAGGAFAPPYGKRNLVGGGTSGAAVAIGGYAYAPDAVNGYPQSTYLYDGSAWTTASPYNSGPNTGQERLSGGGPSTAALKIGGQYYNPATSPNYQNSNSTEEWNGSVWGTGGNFPANMYFGSMSGDSGNAITAFGNTGGPATPGNAFIYDGNSWVTAPSTGTSRQAMGSGGTATAGIIYGGANNAGSGQNATEEFTGVTTAANIKKFTTS